MSSYYSLFGSHENTLHDSWYDMWYSSSIGETEARGCEFKANLGHIVKLSVKTTNKQTECSKFPSCI